MWVLLHPGIARAVCGNPEQTEYYHTFQIARMICARVANDHPHLHVELGCRMFLGRHEPLWLPCFLLQIRLLGRRLSTLEGYSDRFPISIP